MNERPVPELVRALRPEDRAQTYEIYLLSHMDEYAGEDAEFLPEGIPDSPALLQMFNKSRIFVYDDGELKGFVGSQNDRIVWLYVHPNHRGQKIGQQLIDYMLAEMQGQCVGISVIKSNKVALELYVRRGFRVIKDFIFNYQGVPVEVYGMQLNAANALGREETSSEKQ